MADVKKINGYNVKDETARNGLLNKQDIMQFATMPTDTEWGKIVQYIGATNVNYTEGYFYKAIAGLSNIVAPSGATATVTDGDIFTAFIKRVSGIIGLNNFSGIDHITITIQVQNNIVYGYMQYYDANGRTAGVVSNYPLSNYEQNTGITITNVSVNDVITADVESVSTWQQIDVQPDNAGGGSSAEYVDGEYINVKRTMVPNEYITVEYIESDGTGYIDVGAGRNTASKILIEFANAVVAPTIGSYLLGAGNDPTANFLSLVLVDDGYNGYNINGTNTTTKSGAEYDIITLISNYYQKNGDAPVSLPGLQSISNKNLYLFSANDNDTALTPYASARVKRLTMWNANGVQYVNFIPVKRKSDNVAGFYDTARSTFYTCAGLTAGSEITINQITISDKVLRNKTSANNGLAVGTETSTTTAGSNATSVGIGAKAEGTDSMAYGFNAKASANGSIQFGAGTNTQANTIQIGNMHYTFYNTQTGATSINPLLLGYSGGTAGYVLAYDSGTHATWKNIEDVMPVKPEFVPELSNVQGIQKLHYDDYYENAFKADNTKIEFHINMTPTEIAKRANDIYVTVSRWKRNKRIKEDDAGGDEVYIRNRGKYSVMNDQRVKLDHKMYCWRVLDDESLYNENPNKWRFFYTESNYNSISALVSDDPTVWLSCDSTLVSNYATCLNALTSSGGNTVSDIGTAQYIYRYEDGDIDTYVHNGDAAGMANYIAQTVWHCREFYNKADDSRLYLWAQDWEDGSDTVYGIVVNGDFMWNQTTQHFTELSSNGDVVDGYIDIFDAEIDRPDLDFKMFDISSGTVGDFCDYLYDSTVQGYVGDTGINWISYWFDYPVMPTLLYECYVVIPKNIDGGSFHAGERVKLKELIEENTVHAYFEDVKDMTFIMPWDTYYLWLRFLSWQKRCFYDETFSGGSWSVKNLMPLATTWNSGLVFKTRAFGRTRSSYKYISSYTQISEYIEFNLATPENIIRGTVSRSQPMQKRLVITGDGYQGIKD